MNFCRMLKKSAGGVLAVLRGSTYQGVRVTSSLAAALLAGHFEHSAGCFSIVPTEFFRSRLGDPSATNLSWLDELRN
jgi:hypothetical protein